MEQLFGDYRIAKDQKDDDLDTQPQQDELNNDNAGADETSKLLKKDEEDCKNE